MRISFPFAAGTYNLAWAKSGGVFAEQREAGPHGGIDVGASPGTPVLAAGNGVVSKVVENHVAAGTYVDLEHTSGPQKGHWTRYLHLRQSYVRPGDWVREGDTIGLSGGVPGEYGAGNTSGPHLHFELWKGKPFASGSERLNPVRFFGGGGMNPWIIGTLVGSFLIAGAVFIASRRSR